MRVLSVGANPIGIATLNIFRSEPSGNSRRNTSNTTRWNSCRNDNSESPVCIGVNCQKDTNKMSEMPVDFASCNGKCKCMLTIYWLVFQNEQWQAYVNCVPVQGSGSATQTQSSAAGPSTEEQTPAAPSTSSTGSNTEEQASPEIPSTGTQSKQGSSNEEQTPEAPTTQATPAPAADNPSEKTPSTETKTTEAPSLETQDTKCNVPARRLRKKISTV
ncbi:hypothetical protein PI124_g10689 [Phytophthora idaei]|nr:hypothetical protein PI125_g3464 [Phytophthora idaei]KAG3167784.1 hypothetical protein PI126_g3635 [Phytophthora idaei]KAG3244510.1 hypothetical protein PI124_g10689 [Phytophthora idaei]